MSKTSQASIALPVLLTAMLLAGCGILKKKQAEPVPSADPVATAPAPAVTGAAPSAVEPTVTDDAVATPEDFEDEAFEKVTDKTYKAEIEALKKEIEAK